MNKKYLLWQFKDWMIPFIIITVIGLAVSVTNFGLVEVYVDDSNRQIAGIIMSTIITFSLISMVLPIFILKYRFGIRRADFYGQLPFKPKQFRRIVITYGLVLLIISISVSYFLSAGILAIRYFLSPSSKEMTYFFSEETYTVYLANLNFFHIFLTSYLVIIVASVISYFVSSFIVMMNGNVFESIVSIICYQVFASLFLLTLFSYIRYAITHHASNMSDDLSYALTLINNFSLQSGFGISYPLIFDSFILEPLINNKEAADMFANENIGLLVGAILYLLNGAIMGTLCYLVKDPSGEILARRGRPNLFNVISLHLAAFTLYLAVGQIGIIPVGALSLFIVVSVIYFFINVLYRKGFKLLPQQYIPMIIIAVSGIVLTLI